MPTKNIKRSGDHADGVTHKPVRPRKVWCIVDGRGIVVHTGLEDHYNANKRDTIHSFVWYQRTWSGLQAQGYRCVKLVIQEETG